VNRGAGYGLRALFLAAVAVLYLVSIPGNKTEADDAFRYSRQVERTEAPALHPHHPLYIPLMRGLYAGAQTLGYPGRTYPLLLATSLAAALGCLGLLLAGVPFGRPAGAWAAAGLLASLYGFWRYAVDVEIVLPATALALAGVAVALSRRGERHPGFLVAGILLATGGILLHSANLVPLLGVVPYILWRRRGLRAALLHAVATALALALFYGLAWQALAPLRATGQEHEGLLQSGTWIKAVIGAGHSLLSGSFLFAWPAFSDWMQRVFPYRMLEEQIRIGRHTPALLRVLALATFPAALAALGLAAARVIAATGIRLREAWQGWRQGRAKGGVGEVLLEAAWLWLLGAGLMTLLFEPGNPELWVWTQVPVALLFGRSVAVSPASPAWHRATVLVPLLVALHNVVGGAALIQDRDGDYYVAQSAGLRVVASPGDRILTGGHAGFVYYLEYQYPGQVLFAGSVDDAALDEALLGPGRLLVLPDVLAPHPALRTRFPHQARRMGEVHERLRPYLRPLDTAPDVLVADPPGAGRDPEPRTRYPTPDGGG